MYIFRFHTFWKLGRGSAFILFFPPFGFDAFWEVYLLQRSCVTELRMVPASQGSTDPRQQPRHDIQVTFEITTAAARMIALVERVDNTLPMSWNRRFDSACGRS
jgi:hypothetical protein